jgi:hypothetical protein
MADLRCGVPAEPERRATGSLATGRKPVAASTQFRFGREPAALSAGSRKHWFRIYNDLARSHFESHFAVSRNQTR